MYHIIQAVLGAVLNRWRGSGYFGSKGLKQVIMGICISVILYLQGCCIIRSVLCGLMFIPLIAIGWGMVFDLGRGKFDPARWKGWYLILPKEQPDWTFKQKWIVDFCGLSIRGAMITAPIGLVSGHYLYCFVGFLMPVCYELSCRVYRKIGMEDHIALGELIFGSILLGLL